MMNCQKSFDPSAHEGTRDLDASRSAGIWRRSSRAEVRERKNGNGSYLLAVFEILEGEFGGARSIRTSRCKTRASRRSKSANGC